MKDLQKKKSKIESERAVKNCDIYQVGDLNSLQLTCVKLAKSDSTMMRRGVSNPRYVFLHVSF